jgi:NADPH:quinone reductase-like Zn-dependent oxidoreductase
MRQIWISKAGAPEVLEVREAKDPDATEGQVRIRVKAVGVNFADLAARMGMYPDAPPIPCVIGYEASGVIDQPGGDFKEGDRVLAMPRFGGYSDTLVLPAGQVQKMPDAMSFEEGAAMPVAYLTAHHAMMYTGTLHPGWRVMIHSVAGGVGLAALDLAKAKNCVIYGTCSKSKFDFVKERGCQFPIDSAGDVWGEMEKLLDGKKLDLIMDPIGGPSAKKSYQMIGAGGRLVCFGFSAATGTGKSRSLLTAISAVIKMPWWNQMKLMGDNKTVTGINMEHMHDHLEVVQPQIAALIEMHRRGEIKPYYDRSFKFEEAAAAHHYLHDRKAKGKLLLVP